jgi:DNA polymerase-3 subunit epsilon
MSRPPARPVGRLRRRPWRYAGFASLDLELTGLDLERDEIVSFGVVPIDTGRISIGRSTYREVRPGVPMRPASIAVHELRPADLGSSPGFDDVIDDLRRALAERYVLAWAAHVEAAFLSRAFGRSPTWWRKRIIDVRELTSSVERSRHDSSGDRSLTAVARRLGVPVEQPHHALDDALTTAMVFLVLMPELERAGIDTPRALLRAGRS